MVVGRGDKDSSSELSVRLRSRVCFLLSPFSRPRRAGIGADWKLTSFSAAATSSSHLEMSIGGLRQPESDVEWRRHRWTHQ